LLLGMTKTRLVDLMGHCDKTMIDRVYGQYRKGLVEEKELILNYLGEDFLALEELKVSFPERYRAAMARTVPVDDTKKAPDVAGAFSQSFGQSQGLYADNYLM
jgi:integrase